ncbi:MAG: molybdopterin-dependent oxidoreductase [Steroidobacteraceae bacterium]
MNRKGSTLVSRRKLLIGGASAGGLIGAGIAAPLAGPAVSGLYRAGEALSLASHRLLLARNPLAREFSVTDISKSFPTIGTAMPEDDQYQRLLADGFTGWRLPVDGLVARPLAFSLADLRQMPSRTQITAHSCERGWTAIAQWTGVQLARVLSLAQPLPAARYVVIYCVDGWYDSYSLDAFEALHPQTILAYGMNGRDLPVRHGAPVRLRIERQLGWKSLKFIHRIQLVDRLDGIGKGKRSFVADEFDFQWYGGI